MITGYGESYNWFSTNRALFAFGEIFHAVDKYRYTDVNYGIVMQPKLDERQGKSIAPSTTNCFCRSR